MNGYMSVGMGKIFHVGKASGFDDQVNLSEPYFHAPNLGFWSIHNSWKAVTKADDEQTAEHAIKTMKRLAQNKDNPFFLSTLCVP